MAVDRTATSGSKIAGARARRPVDNFQDGTLSSPTIGGAVSHSPGLTASVVAMSGDAQNETYALRAEGSLGLAIRDSNGWATPAAIAAHGSIPRPMKMCPPSPQSCAAPVVYDHVGAVRSHLSVFGAHGAVDGVRLVFQPDSAGRDSVIDSVERAERIYKP